MVTQGLDTRRPITKPHRLRDDLGGKAIAAVQYRDHGHYLRPGDRINARIWSRDKALDLGEQITELVA